MTNDIQLYVAFAGDETNFQFTSNTPAWKAVLSQIEGAVSMGRGLIEIPRANGVGKAVYVYGPAVAIRWVQTS